MLSDTRICELHDYFDATDCFPEIDISGGVCYFLRDIGHQGDCQVTSYRNGRVDTMTRPLRWKQNNTFIRFNEAISILDKVHKEGSESFADGISSRKPFGLPTNVVVKTTRNTGDVKIFAYPDDGFIAKSSIDRNIELVETTKVLVSYVYGERGHL